MATSIDFEQEKELATILAKKVLLDETMPLQKAVVVTNPTQPQTYLERIRSKQLEMPIVIK